MTHITPRNSITINGALPKRWNFHSINDGSKKAWEWLLLRIDMVAEHADSLMNANGISADSAVDQAINGLIKSDESRYVSGYYWNLTPTHRKAIVKWLTS